MDLVNHTPLVSRATVTQLNGVAERCGVVIAKATFHFSQGETQLDTQSLVALSLQPVPTELGALPPDLPYLAWDDRFEVVVLGCAHSSRPITEMRVAVSVGAVRNELIVTGDRVWMSRGSELEMSAPVPFTRMPLTWERAFGGRCQVEIDDGAFIEVLEPLNPDGRGLDVEVESRRHAGLLKAPNGFPRYSYRRAAPNVERPGYRITCAQDRPEPACWATRPLVTGLRAKHLVDGLSAGRPTPREAESFDSLLSGLRSAVDEWVIDRPELGVPVVLDGLTPDGKVSFPLPRSQVFADYVVGKRQGTLSLPAQQLVLLPETKRLLMVYGTMFRVPYQPDEERSLRLRLESSNG